MASGVIPSECVCWVGVGVVVPLLFLWHGGDFVARACPSLYRMHPSVVQVVVFQRLLCSSWFVWVLVQALAGSDFSDGCAVFFVLE